MELNSRETDITAIFDKGLQAHNAGDLSAAEQLYQETLAIKPEHPEANHNIGVVLVAKNELDKALSFFKFALDNSPNVSLFWASYIDTLIKLERIGESKTLIKAVKNAGISCDKIEAISLQLNGLYQEPDAKDCQEFDELLEQQKFVDAIKICLSLTETYPSSAVLNITLGKCYFELGQIEQAISSCKKATEYQPNWEIGFALLGQIYSSQGNVDEAIEAYKKTLSLKPDCVDAHFNLGVTLRKQGKLEEAIEAYNKVLSIKPDYAEVYNNMGNTLKDQGKLEAAIETYNKALALKPDYAEGHYNMGVALKEQGKLEEAIEAYNKALVIKPDYAAAYHNMGNALQEQGKLEGAIEAYNKALVIKPSYESSRAQKLYQQAHICDWDGIDKDIELLPRLGTIKEYVPPFCLLSLEDAPERHRTRSEIYAKARYPQKPLPRQVKPSQKPKRIRLGYFSSDFKEHPVAYLMAKMLEQHDRDQFEVFGYSLHGNQQTDMRQRLSKSFDSFADVQGMTDSAVALQARQDGIDIAIDLNGYTQHSRIGIFAYLAAPIQINYLGWPGTLGADFMDYIVADRFLIPEGNQKYFNEKPLYLPNTYMPTDDTRELSQKPMSRRDVELPDDAFVFCCFNKNYKISSAEFDIWMRLLNKVEGSVLWLRKSNEISHLNMKKEAEKRSIDPSRLVFADRAPMDEHLARQRLADLFVDTFAFNAHTTATEALWAGLPVVTKAGQGFAARVAGSLLNAIGLPELVTTTEQDYEELILELATNPRKLAKIKEKLVANRLTQPLFNTELYTKHLENGYQQAYQNHFDGNPPQTITVRR